MPLVLAAVEYRRYVFLMSCDGEVAHNNQYTAVLLSSCESEKLSAEKKISAEGMAVASLPMPRCFLSPTDRPTGHYPE